MRQQSVACQVRKQDHGVRPLAVCTANNVELNHALVAAGWAMADGSSADLRDAETEARAGRRGLWREPVQGR